MIVGCRIRFLVLRLFLIFFVLRLLPNVGVMDPFIFLLRCLFLVLGFLVLLLVREGFVGLADGRDRGAWRGLAQSRPPSIGFPAPTMVAPKVVAGGVASVMGCC